uniref:Multivesicular body subunit 12A n=1 Tax=Strigamia maritima TaxID=126957 RepID=T1J7R7_STRMM
MRDLWNALPDNRPITAICVVEEPMKCPPGFSVVSRTYDQDTDADLWKDGFFGRKITRYLCISKTEGQTQYIVEDIAVINEKEPPPEGFTLLSHTLDTEQKAMRKKQLCYKLVSRKDATQAVTDVIVLSKIKKAPQGFTLSGELNSLLICYKTGPVPTNNSNTMSRSYTGTLPYSTSPAVAPAPMGPPPPVPQSLPYPVNPYASSQVNSLYPLNAINQLRQTGPTNAAVQQATPNQQTLNQMLGGMTWPGSLERSTPPPVPNMSSSYVQSPSSPMRSNTSTLSTSSLLSNYGLDGIPFELNPKYKDLQLLRDFNIPKLPNKSAADLEAEYTYDFSSERQAQQRIPRDLQ